MSLRTSELPFIARHYGSTSLLRLEYQFPKEPPEYIEELIPKFLEGFPQLRVLKIDAADVKERSLGKIVLN